MLWKRRMWHCNTTDKKWCTGTWWRIVENESWSRSHLTWWTWANPLEHFCSETSWHDNHFQSRVWPQHFSKRDSEFSISRLSVLLARHWRMEFILEKRWWWLESATNDVDEEDFHNDGNERNEAREDSAGDRRAIADADQSGQLGISGEARNARSLLVNRRQMLRKWHTTWHMFHSEIGVRSVLWVVDEVFRTDELWWTGQRAHCRNSRQTTCPFEQWKRAKLSHVSHSWKRAVEWWSASWLRWSEEGNPSTYCRFWFPQPSCQSMRQRDEYHWRV